MEEVKRQIEELGKSFEAWKAANATAMAELKQKGEVSAFTQEKLAKLDAALQKADEAKSAAERILTTAASPEGARGDKARKLRPGEQAYREKFGTYLRSGDVTKDEMRDARKAVENKTLSSLSDPDGGYYIGFDTDDEMVRVITETSPVRQVARVRTISQASLKGRLRQGRAATGGWVGEADARPVTGTPQVGEWEVTAREMYAMPDAPQSFLEDAETDVEAWLADELAEEFSVLENTAFVLGNTPKRPRGFLTYANGTDPLQQQIEQIATATNDVFAADDLIALQTALKEPYQGNASWALSRQMLGNVRRFVTGGVIANYVWQPGLQLGVPSQILGRPYVLMQDMATAVADAALIVAYGDFRRAYLIVDRRGTTVLRDPYTNKGFVNFYTTRRVGGGVINFEALKILRVQ